MRPREIVKIEYGYAAFNEDGTVDRGRLYVDEDGTVRFLTYQELKDDEAKEP